jgi:hypothetical protein
MRGFSFSLVVLIVLLTLAGASPARAVRVKVVMTQSNGPNDTFPDVTTTTEFDVTVGGKFFDFTDDNVLVREDVPSGLQKVTVEAGQLGSAYRVGSAVFTPSLTGVSTLCNPDSDGGITVDLDPALINTGGSVDFVVAIRIVAKDSEPLEGGVTCGGPIGCPAAAGIHPLACSVPPEIRGVTIPPNVLAGAYAPLAVDFSDIDADVSSVIVEEQTLNNSWKVIGDVGVSDAGQAGTLIVGIKCGSAFGTVFATDYVIRVTLKDGGGNGTVGNPLTFKCIAKPLMTRIGKVMNLGGGVLAAVGGALTPIPPEPVSAAAAIKLKQVLIGSGLLWTGAAFVDITTFDPPDPNFTVVAEPDPPTIAPLAGEGAGVLDAAYLEAFDQLLANSAALSGAQRAFLLALERVQGAGEAGDLFWYSEQMAAAGRQAANMAAILEARPALGQAVQNADEGSPQLVCSVADAQAFQAQVQSAGLPESVTTLLNDFGAGDSRIPGIVESAALREDPNALAGSAIDKLAGPDLDAAVDEAKLSLRGFASVAGSSCGSCDDGNACTDDACANASCTHALRAGVEGLACLVDRLLPAACGSVPRGITKGLAKARTLAQSALANSSKANKLLLKARKALAKVAVAAAKAKKKGKIGADCADPLTTGITDVRGRIKSFAAP